MQGLPPNRQDLPRGQHLESTASLLLRARTGDDLARNQLDQRYRPLLRKLAHGRIPAGARDLVDTEDLVQETLVRAFTHLERFEPRREGAFLAYLRQILLNRIRDEARRAARRPPHQALLDDLVDPGPTPIEEVMGREGFEAYERALSRLTEDEREGVMLKVEFGYTNAQLAEALERPSVGAARMFVARALLRLIELMRQERKGG